MKRKAIKEIKSAKARNAEHARRWRLLVKGVTKVKDRKTIADLIIDKQHEKKQMFLDGHTHTCIVDKCNAEYGCTNACEQAGGAYAPCPKCFAAATDGLPERRKMDRRSDKDRNRSRKIL